jgi:hypothetical protein
MAGALWHADLILFGVPMVGALLSAMFRIDELVADPVQRRRRLPERLSRQGRPLSDWDEKGVAMCVEPDGTTRTRSGMLIRREGVRVPDRIRHRVRVVREILDEGAEGASG